MTVLCVNPNPAVDRVAVVNFSRGGMLRPIRSFEWPGGSGVHAAHVANQLGSKVEILAVVGGDYGLRFKNLAESHKLKVHAIENSAETRSTFTLLDAEDGNICDIAEYGGKADSGVAKNLLAEFESIIQNHRVCVLSGSLLKNLPSDLYASMSRIARDASVPVIIDATGEALLATTKSPVFLVKASLEELTRDGVIGNNFDSAQVLKQVGHWLTNGVENVCVSLGSAGLMWGSADGIKLLMASPQKPYNTVGCGDTMVGAVAAAIDKGKSIAEALVDGVAAATANLSYDAPGHCTGEDVAKLISSVKIENGTEGAVHEAILASRPK